jgi:hypothetical protein
VQVRIVDTAPETRLKGGSMDAFEGEEASRGGRK